MQFLHENMVFAGTFSAHFSLKISVSFHYFQGKKIALYSCMGCVLSALAALSLKTVKFNTTSYEEIARLQTIIICREMHDPAISVYVAIPFSM